MSKTTSVTCFNPFDVVSQVDAPERLFSQNAQLSYQPALEESADDIATMDARKGVLEELEFQEQLTESKNHPETIEQSHFMKVVNAALWDIINDEVERKAADCVNDCIATAVEETFMETMKQVSSFNIGPAIRYWKSRYGVGLP